MVGKPHELHRKVRDSAASIGASGRRAGGAQAARRVMRGRGTE